MPPIPLWTRSRLQTPPMFSLEDYLLHTLIADSCWQEPLGWAIGSRGALPMGNLALQPGPAPVNLCALDYLPDAWPGTSCREAQGTILLREMEYRVCVWVCVWGVVL